MEKTNEERIAKGQGWIVIGKSADDKTKSRYAERKDRYMAPKKR